MTRADATFRVVVSAEARRFIKERMDGRDPVDDSARLEDVEVLRNTNREDCRAGVEAAVAEFSAYLDDAVWGDVRCLETRTPSVGSDTNRGAVLYLFGGGFIVGGPWEDISITAPIADGLGVPVVSPFYPLAPEHPFPAALDASVAVYRAMARRHGTSRLAVVGESAGGNLALATVLRARDEGIEMPAAVVALSPWSDLRSVGHSFDIDADPTLRREGVRNAISSAYAGSTGLNHPLVSPLRADYTPGFPATMLTTGTRDLFRSLQVRLALRLQAARVPVVLRVWDEMWHVFEYYREVPEARESMEEVVAFLSSSILSPTVAT